MELHEIERQINLIEDSRELDEVYGFVKDRRRTLGNKLKRTLNVGDRVAINNGRGIDEGTVIKINRTRAVVDMRGGSWNVPFAMISKMGDSDE